LQGHSRCSRLYLDKQRWDCAHSYSENPLLVPHPFPFLSQASTWLIPAAEAPTHHTASCVCISFCCIIVTFSNFNLLYLRHENAKKANKRDKDEREGREIDPEEWQRLGDKHPHYIYAY
jgi:hypothetical protein